ncbi:MAG: PadR family transcriptional regulator [Proteobacteria bacterium]|nr:PadR family transcriptional regulator [Pseudomonadota bacterium]
MDVKTLCLAVLSKGQATGYEIKKAFEEGPFSHFQTASFGAIYPALARLTAEGMVTVTVQAQDGKPDKKIYELTAQGRSAFLATLDIQPGPDQIRSDLLFLLFFAEHLPPARILTLIDARVAAYTAMIAKMDELDAQGHCDQGREFVRGFGRSVYQAAADYLDTHRDTLVAQIFEQHHEAAE